MKRFISLATVVAVVLLASISSALATTPLKVVTTLSTYAAIAQAVGGDLVEVKFIASPRFNPHFIEPKPSDVFKVKSADLFIHSGLDLEAWRGPLLDAAARADLRQAGEHQLDLSTRIALLEVPDHQVSRAEGDIHLFGNPHYWLDPRNGKIIAEEIAAKLTSMDPSHAATYEKNLATFVTSLEKKLGEWTKSLSDFKGQELIGYHNEWVYLMNFAGLTMKQFLEPKPGIPPTPKHVEFILGYIQSQSIRAIVQATFNPAEAANSIAARSGAKRLTLCQNVGEIADVPDYISMIDFNVSKLVEALRHD